MARPLIADHSVLARLDFVVEQRRAAPLFSRIGGWAVYDDRTVLHLLDSEESDRAFGVLRVVGHLLAATATVAVGGRARIHAQSAKSLAGSEDAFVLTFSAPRSAALEGGTHSFRHRCLGTFELFVSPVGRPGTERRYEAVVDRSVAAPRLP